MNVLQMRDLLNELIEAGYGEFQIKKQRPAVDYWKTELASDVNEPELGHVSYSNYHQEDAILDQEKVEQLVIEAHQSAKDEGIEPPNIELDAEITGLQYDGKDVQGVILI